MNYEDTIKKINSLLKFGVKPGLERIKKLMDKLQNPQNKLKFIHVAGTNGKGSTCTMIASVLKNSGYKTGLFTSPFVVDFRERIQINSEFISKEDLINLTNEIFPIVENMKKQGDIITEFEFIVAIAFKWFYEQNCDIVVLEVGLGGRFDATNIIKTPLLSIITSISLDHTHILGKTFAEITFEKCGIIKNFGTTVVYPEQKPEVYKIIKKITAERKNKLVISNFDNVKIIKTDLTGNYIKYKETNFQIPLIGEHQIKNLVTVLASIDCLRNQSFIISDENLKNGLKNSFIPARLEILNTSPLIMLDGAHNIDAAFNLSKFLENNLANKKIFAIFGVMKDKDTENIIKILAPFFYTVITVTPNNKRAMTSDILDEKFKKYCKNVIPINNINDSIKLALKMATKKDVILICGSLYLAGDVKQLLKN